jgi:hypothetical protein
VVAYQGDRQIGAGTYQVHFADVGQRATWDDPEPIKLLVVQERGEMVGVLADAWQAMLEHLRLVEQQERAARSEQGSPIDLRSYRHQHALHGGRVFEARLALSGRGVTWRLYDIEDRPLGDGTCTSLVALRAQLAQTRVLNEREISELVAGVAGSALVLPELPRKEPE